MPGGVGGEEPRGSPLSRSLLRNTQSVERCRVSDTVILNQERSMNGAQSLFKSLVDAGITTCFANPGTSEMVLVYEIGLTDRVRPVLCLQEDVVTGAADGYGRMKGAPAFTLLHVACGFANGIAMLHNAGRANTPVANVLGSHPSYHHPNYPEHQLINGRVTDLPPP